MKVTALIRSLCSDGRFAGTVNESPEVDLIGKTIFVPHVIPDEIVTAEVKHQEKKFIDGHLVSIIKNSPLRITPPCKYFGECGGCTLQHLDILQQQKLKKELFLQTFKKVTGSEYQGKLISFSKGTLEYNYRKRINLHWRDKKLGFYQEDSHQVIPIDSCLLAKKEINQTLEILNQNQEDFPEFLSDVTIEMLEERDALVLFKLDPKIKHLPKASLNQLIALKKQFSNMQIVHGAQILFSNITKEHSLGYFSQVNPTGNKHLQDLVLSNLTTNNVTELYAGGGNFTFPINHQGKKIVAVESDLNLVKFAKEQINKKQLKDLHFVHGRAEDFVKKNLIRESLVLDPPRAGAKEVLRNANFSKTTEILYVSCNPATFARDVQILTERGFDLEFIQLVDMFPQTAHLEIFARIIPRN